jgi:ribonuclease P/MRP protein subunit POP1
MKEDNTPMARGKSGSGIGKGTVSRLQKEGMKRAKRKRQKRESKREEEGKITVTKAATKEESAPKDTDKATSVDGKKRKNKTTLATPSLPPAKFRKRQIHKCWLPTHLFHTKRAHMTSPKEPLWRFSIALTPTIKSYRHTHRAATLRGAVAWDMSYISTVGLQGPEGSIIGLLKGLHFCFENDDDPWDERSKAQKWRDGLRVWEGWLYEREGNLPKEIAPVTVVWSVKDQSDDKKRKAFIRVHPASFLHLWNELLRVAKVQKPAVSVEDLRFEMGSIEITGPAATECLCAALNPVSSPKGQAEILKLPEAIWKTLAPVTNLNVLPKSVLLGFSITDPRLRYPPRTVETAQDASSQAALTRTVAYWPVDNTQTAPAIFNHNARLAAGRSLPSQKSINRRKGTVSPGEFPEPRSTDPQIPILAFTSQSSNSWTVLLPWKCVMPVWRYLMFYPVSTGGNPKFGGLTERRQTYFERSAPWFPGDFPGTAAGWTWELQQRVEREKEWLKRPKGKRVEWASVDLGNEHKGEVGKPWACDWERLLHNPTEKQSDKKDTADHDMKNAINPFRHLSYSVARDLIMHPSSPSLGNYISIPHLFTIKVTLVQRGVPTNCARIYRLPSADSQLRSKWLSLMPGAPNPDNREANRQTRNNRALSKHLQRRALAASLLESDNQNDGAVKAGHADYPVVPGEEDLIGFVTTGNYNLAEGRMTAVGNLCLGKVIEKAEKGPVNERSICIVRNAGQSLGRLAKWEIV